MTTQKNKYHSGKIYKIINDSMPELVYYGSTCQRLSARMACHRQHWKQGNKNITSTILNAIGKPTIVLVENVKCDTKEELYRRERYYIENYPCVNKRVPLRTRTEFYQDNKHRWVERYQEHKKDPAWIKQRRQSSLDYYQKNKEKARARNSEKIECPCGMVTSKGNFWNHRRTQNHKDRMMVLNSLPTIIEEVELVCPVVIEEKESPWPL